ncbi:MAG TPA: hypothetical protein VNH18_35370 [Bryobacteraceae bacterium]|nr:hypothetical protein [Bryobacteraceae bacterium]
MRGIRASLAWVAAAVLAGCGYPGEPLPPALNRPTRVMDVAAIERGAKIYVTFTIPTQTTEGLALKSPPDIELRVGTIGDTFVPADWEQHSERLPADALKVNGGQVEAQIPAAKFYGRTIVAGVRVRGPQGRDVGWSNLEVVNVLPELPVPEALAAREAPGGVELEWRVPRAAREFRVFRRLKGEKDWTFAGLSDKTSYLDTSIEYGREYEYFVQAGEKTGAKYAESDLSAIVEIKPSDHFPPGAPASLAAVPGTKSIELVWDRNTEADVASYRVYRDGVKVADALQSPAFSDKDVMPGAKHTYEVTAVDTAGNESPRSAPTEVTVP